MGVQPAEVAPPSLCLASPASLELGEALLTPPDALADRVDIVARGGDGTSDVIDARAEVAAQLLLPRLFARVSSWPSCVPKRPM